MKKLIVLGCLIMLCSASFAQTNFSGNYTKESIEYIDGPKYGNALPETYNIQQTADSIIIVGATSRSGYAMNGGKSTSTSAANNRKFVRSLSWSADKKSVTLITEIYAEGNPNELDLTRVATWNLSADGKQLLVSLKSVETKSESWSVTGVFNKN